MKASQNQSKLAQEKLEEIKAKLRWFHGEEFEKYPFMESDTSLVSLLN